MNNEVSSEESVAKYILEKKQENNQPSDPLTGSSDGKKRLKSERSTIAYLNANPDFFLDKEDLLTVLQLPHVNGNAVSLIEKQVNVLRQSNNTLKKQLNDLFCIAKENETSASKLHQLILSLLSANSINAISQAIQIQISQQFSIETVMLKVFSESEQHLSMNPDIYLNASSKEVKNLLKLVHKRKPVCGYFPEIEFIQNAKNASLQVGSMAVLPLFVDKNACLGAVILGSSNTRHFSPDTGTLFLQNIAEVISHALIRHL